MEPEAGEDVFYSGVALEVNLVRFLDDRVQLEDRPRVPEVRSQRYLAVCVDTQVLPRGGVTKPHLLIPPNNIT